MKISNREQFIEFVQNHTKEEIQNDYKISGSYIQNFCKTENIKYKTKKEKRIEQIKKLAEESCTKEEIAKKLKISIYTVTAIGRENKIKIKSVYGNCGEKNEMIEYLAQKYTYQSIGNLLGCSRQNVEQIVNKREKV